MKYFIIDTDALSTSIHDARADLQHWCINNGQTFDITPLQENAKLLPILLNHAVEAYSNGIDKQDLINELSTYYFHDVGSAYSNLNEDDYKDIFTRLLKDL